MSWPMKVTRPELAGVTPQMVLTRVVLPAPFGPINPSTSPRLMPSVTARSARKPLKCRDTASRRRISDMFCFLPEHAGTDRNQTTRQEQQEHDDQRAEHTAVDLDIVAPDHFLETKIEKCAADHAQWRSKPSHQRHHYRLYGVENIEHVGRVDIMHPRRIKAAGGADKTGGESERDALVERGVQADHVGGSFVLASPGEPKAELRHRDDHHHQR